jgi:hypothetical protein
MDDDFYEEALTIAYGEYLAAKCKCTEEFECGCISLQRFEDKFLRDLEEQKYAGCDW